MGERRKRPLGDRQHKLSCLNSAYCGTKNYTCSACQGLDIYRLPSVTPPKDILCRVPHPNMVGVTCDLLANHDRGEHEACIEKGSIVVWTLSQSERDKRVFEWAAGLNHNPYKRNGHLRTLASDHQATSCIDDDAATRARKLEDQRRGIHPLVD